MFVVVLRLSVENILADCTNFFLLAKSVWFNCPNVLSPFFFFFIYFFKHSYPFGQKYQPAFQ